MPKFKNNSKLDTFLTQIFIAVIFNLSILNVISSPIEYYTANDKFPTYPYYQHIQVRKQITFEHVPRSPVPISPLSSFDSYGSSTNYKNPQLSSTNEKTPQMSSSNLINYPNDFSPSHLTHEVLSHKNQEVFEERGYTDAAFEDSKNYANGNSDLKEQDESSSNHENKKIDAKGLKVGGSSTKLLKHISENLHDRDAELNGIYLARSKIHCPEVTDFKNRERRVRGGKGVTGLRSRMDCIKLKYFGKEPLPSTVFSHPSISRHQEIEIGTLNDFMKDFKSNVQF